MRALAFVAALGGIQGALVLILIACRFRHGKNTPLALLLLVFSLRLATIPTWDYRILLEWPWIYPATAPLPFLFGPLLWWYARELGRHGSGRPRCLPLHALPWLAETAAVSLTIILMTPGEYETFLIDVFAGNPPSWLPIRNALKVVLNLVYVAAAARIAYGGTSKRLSPGRRIWIRSMVTLSGVVLAVFSYVAVVPGPTARLGGGQAGPFFLLAALMAGLTYLVSLLVIIAPEVSANREERTPRRPEPLCSDSDCDTLARRLEEYLESGAFRDPDLALADAAAGLNVHANRLSYAVNHARSASFRSVLNACRVKEFVRRVDDGALERRSILELAFDAGFPSKSTFNRVFKEEVGINPTEYAAGRRMSDYRDPTASAGDSRNSKPS